MSVVTPAACTLAIALATAAIIIASINSSCPNYSDIITVQNGVAVIDYSKTVCIGPVADCASIRLEPGYIHAFVPISIGSHTIVPSRDSISLVYSDQNQNQKPIAFFKDGGALIGASPYYLQKNAITLTATPIDTPTTPINGDWLPSSIIYFVDPVTNASASFAFVCHVLDSSMCGKLLQNSPSDPGIYTSDVRTIIGPVKYGMIVSNTQAQVLVHNLTVATVTNNGIAVPCTQLPPYSDHYTTNLYLEAYPLASCTNRVGRPIRQVVLQNTCLTASSQPALYFLSTTAYPDIIANSMFVTYDNTVTVAFYTDTACATIIATQVSYVLGCPPAQPYQWYYSSI